MAARLPLSLRLVGCRFMSGEWGSGAGKGGGSGGSIRDAGGSFGRMEAAREEEYFRKQSSLMGALSDKIELIEFLVASWEKQQREQLAKMKESLGEEIDFHKQQIAMHKQAKQLAALHDHLEEEVSHHKEQIKRHQQAKQLAALHDHLEEEVSHHKEQIKQHQEAIDRHKKKISKIKDVQDDD